MSGSIFRDRRQAGSVLARVLGAYANRSDAIVLALPRGGIPVACEVAHALHLPFDVFIVRQLGVPGRAEYAMGAIASGGVRVLNNQVVKMLGITDAAIDVVVRCEQRELERRERLYRDSRPAPDVRGRAAILIDDGLATGSTMQAAVKALQRLEPARVVVAMPAATRETCDPLRHLADEVVCATTPQPWRAAGLWYEDSSQTSDDEVRELLA